ncbi:MAG: filamentous hemagglutinin N-terminal domain-containing protein [Candidatus Competibacteraceae bacterium]|nr:filamentous hemagglutinin N-terminal domain-containing protein [Candidatus Competibacteraceae bacterium]
MRYTRGWAIIMALSNVSSSAQIVLDGTLGPTGALPGPDYAITADLGQQHGGNLFHSFGQFSIRQGESATFSGPSSVSNIISRVTGGQVSTIDGMLRSTIPGANLYLLNPAGVLFRENARLDVSGSFHASTADYLRLGDGGRFDAQMPANTLLTVAPVEAFGFLGNTPGTIAIQGSFLQAPDGQTLSLIGGDIALSNATVYAPAGRLNVATVNSAGEVIPTAHGLTMRGFARLGTLIIERDPNAEKVTIDLGEPFGEVALGDLDASGAGGGAIFIRGGQWFSQGGRVFADTHGPQAGQGIDAAISGNVGLVENALLTTETLGEGAAGSLRLSADNLFLANSNMASVTRSAGDAGNVALVVTDTLTLRDGGQIFASTFAGGDAGSVAITANNLRVNRGLIASSANPGSSGDGGNVNLSIANTLTLQNAGQILAGTWAGNAGTITIATGNLLVDGQGSRQLTGITSSAYCDSIGSGGGSRQLTGITSSAYCDSTGSGGDIHLAVADTLILRNGGQIDAFTEGPGKGGSVTITAGRAVNITGNEAGLFVGARDAGNAGDVTVTTPALTIDDGGRISATSEFTTGGNLLINADHLKLLNGSEISSSVFGDATTQGGDVTLNSINAVALDGSKVTAQARQGKGGNIVVNAEAFLHDAPTINDVLNASSDISGNDGTVQNNAPTTDISGSLATLNPPYLDATSQLSGRCSVIDPEEKNRFIVQGRGVLPPSPEDALPARMNRCSAEFLTRASMTQEDAPAEARSPAPTLSGFNNR